LHRPRGHRGPGIRTKNILPGVRLIEIENAILDALLDGPKTPGQLLGFHLPGLKAELRDEALEGLLRRHEIRLVRVPHTSLRGATLLAVALRKGAARG
jgi:hypothetical protein